MAESKQERTALTIVKPVGHDAILEQFANSLARGRLGSGYLFVGLPGIGKRMTANWIAQALLCDRTPADQLDACGTCPACQQIAAQSHPDFEVVEKPADKSTIPVDLLIGDKNHRMREGLCARIAMSPARGGRKIAIIDDADFLSQESANCLLKTLEEPPPAATLILIGTSAQRQLPTIRSRCQTVSFQPLPQTIVRQLLLDRGLAQDESQAAELAAAAGGSMTRAAALGDGEIWDFQSQLCNELARDWKPYDVSKMILEFVDAAGKDAAPRRERQKLVMELTGDFYLEVMRALVGNPSQAHSSASAEALAGRWTHSAEALAECVERCLVAQNHVTANANQATNIEAWIDDLYELTQHGMNAARNEYAV